MPSNAWIANKTNGKNLPTIKIGFLNRTFQLIFICFPPLISNSRVLYDNNGKQRKQRQTCELDHADIRVVDGKQKRN